MTEFEKTILFTGADGRAKFKAEAIALGEGTPQALLVDKSPAVNQFIHGLPDGVVPFHYPAGAYAQDMDMASRV